MQCNEVRRILWPADSLRLGDEKVEEALRHAESCARCHAFLDRDRQLAQLIRESVPRAQAPPAFPSAVKISKGRPFSSSLMVT